MWNLKKGEFKSADVFFILNKSQLVHFRSSKSLLANVLDIDDDFRHNCRPLTPGGTLPHNPTYYRTVFRLEIEGFHKDFL
jgi:hypothetical protein